MLSLLCQLTCCQDTELQTKGPINKVNTWRAEEEKQGLPGMGLKASLQKVCLITMCTMGNRRFHFNDVQ